MWPKEKVIELLEQVVDPELPFLSIVELHIVRDILWDDEKQRWSIHLTPTYFGCVAMERIEKDIHALLGKSLGESSYTLNKVFAPPWTSDWLSEGTKEKLKRHGIAPPQLRGKNFKREENQKRLVVCPFCESLKTKQVAQFGPTACKALWKCQECLLDFEEFKCL